MFDDLDKNDIKIASGIIPYIEWMCGGFLGRGRGEDPNENYLIDFHPELVAVMKQIDVLEGASPSQHDTAWEGHYWKDDNGNFYEVVPTWFDRIDKICDELNIRYETHEEEVEFDDLENYYHEESLYCLGEGDEEEEWYGKRKHDSELPWFGFVCRTMTKKDYKRLLAVLTK
jgi:hypothetical protein